MSAKNMQEVAKVVRRTSAEIFWSEDDGGWIAIDRLRPGCSAFGNSEEMALRQLQDARHAWDGAKRNAHAPSANQRRQIK